MTGDKYRPDFASWLLANGHIWTRFCAEADRVWTRGRRHYSARTLIEYIRHETALSEIGGDFKVNNNYAPDLARLYADTFPDRADLFEFREQRNSARGHHSRPGNVEPLDLGARFSPGPAGAGSFHQGIGAP